MRSFSGGLTLCLLRNDIGSCKLLCALLARLMPLHDQAGTPIDFLSAFIYILRAQSDDVHVFFKYPEYTFYCLTLLLQEGLEESWSKRKQNYCNKIKAHPLSKSATKRIQQVHILPINSQLKSDVS